MWEGLLGCCGPVDYNEEIVLANKAAVVLQVLVMLRWAASQCRSCRARLLLSYCGHYNEEWHVVQACTRNEWVR